MFKKLFLIAFSGLILGTSMPNKPMESALTSYKSSIIEAAKRVCAYIKNADTITPSTLSKMDHAANILLFTEGSVLVLFLTYYCYKNKIGINQIIENIKKYRVLAQSPILFLLLYFKIIFLISQKYPNINYSVIKSLSFNTSLAAICAYLCKLSLSAQRNLTNQLYKAIQDNDTTKLNNLILLLTDINGYLSDEDSVLEEAAKRSATNTMKFLLPNWAKHLYTQEAKNNALYTAVIHNNHDLAELLLQKGADANYIPDTRELLLITNASFLQDLPMVQILLKYGANVNLKDKNNNSPLHLTKNVEIAKELLNHGADVNAQDNDGVTALMALAINATEENKLHEAFKIVLYNCGPTLGLKDGWGNTILDYANQPKIKDVLEKYMSELNVKIEEGTGLIPDLVGIIAEY